MTTMASAGRCAHHGCPGPRSGTRRYPAHSESRPTPRRGPADRTPHDRLRRSAAVALLVLGTRAAPARVVAPDPRARRRVAAVAVRRRTAVARRPPPAVGERLHRRAIRGRCGPPVPRAATRARPPNRRPARSRRRRPPRPAAAAARRRCRRRARPPARLRPGRARGPGRRPAGGCSLDGDPEDRRRDAVADEGAELLVHAGYASRRNSLSGSCWA